MINMTKEFLSGKIDGIAYSLDFPYELEQRYKKMHREDGDYCDLIYECLYEEGVARYNELSDTEFKKLIRKQCNYIKKIAKEGFYLLKMQLHRFDVKLHFLWYGMCSSAYLLSILYGVTSIRVMY